MLNVKTVFVLGAGASVEAGLPTGAGLTRQIAQMLAMRWELNRQTAGDYLIPEALIYRARAASEDQTWDITREIHAARRIAVAMDEALSIDNYMEAHSNDAAVMTVGKLAIARAISEAERKSKVWLNVRSGQDFDPGQTKDTWLHSFWQLLHQGVPAIDVERVFSNLTVISFNYDRCLQQRLFFGLRSYYNLDDKQALEALGHLNIQFPYGSLGPYTGPVSFGANYDANQLLNVSNGIKTFSERVDDQACLNAIRVAISNAERIVLLGCAFHPQNMAVMAAPTSVRPRTYATAYGIPPSNIAPIKSQLMALVDFQHRPVVDFATCADFFRNQWFHLIQ